MTYSFPNLETVCYFMSGSSCCFLTCMQISQEGGAVGGAEGITDKAGKMVWYSHLFKNFPQFVVIHIVKDFSIVNEAKVDIFLEFSCFLYDQMDVLNNISL